MVAWVNKGCKDGVTEVELKSWNGFYELVTSSTLEDSSAWVWRGQRLAKWRLESSLDRLEQTAEGQKDRDQHLATFKIAARGRRGLNPPRMSENEWWALGQHFGLATPLLDWTSSPFVAAFFACDIESDQKNPRAVYGLRESIVTTKSGELDGAHKAANKPGRPDTIEFIRPDTDENPRIVSQAGLFTRLPAGVNVEEWIQRHFKGVDGSVLVRIVIPDEIRLSALRDLNRMNINHATLFPDLEGAGLYANMKFRVKNF